MCVGSVCVYNHPIMIKIHPVFFFFFFFSLNHFPFLKSSRSQMPVSVTAFQHRLDWCLTLDLPWVSCEHVIVSKPEQE